MRSRASSHRSSSMKILSSAVRLGLLVSTILAGVGCLDKEPTVPLRRVPGRGALRDASHTDDAFFAAWTMFSDPHPVPWSLLPSTPYDNRPFADLNANAYRQTLGFSNWSNSLNMAVTGFRDWPHYIGINMGQELWLACRQG